jgi:RHS repeat-associated protein
MNATYAQLCRYHYDPLDRLATCSPAEQLGIQRFYQKNRLTTEIQGQIQRAFFQTEDQLLAQHQGPNTCTLLASDQQRSVLEGLDAQRQSASYTPYGVRHPQANPLELLGYTGERADPVTGHYLLGNGYRAYNPVLMRFNSPDSLSPFGKGGLNAYAYCTVDPVNGIDPTGHIVLKNYRLHHRKTGLTRKPSFTKLATPKSQLVQIARAESPRARLVSDDIHAIVNDNLRYVRTHLEAATRVAEKMSSIMSTTYYNESLFNKAAMAFRPGELLSQRARIPDALFNTVIPNAINSAKKGRFEQKFKTAGSDMRKFDFLADNEGTMLDYFNSLTDDPISDRNYDKMLSVAKEIVDHNKYCRR